MESECYDKYIQWFPREITEDLLELDCHKMFNEEECTEEDSDDDDYADDY